MLTDIPTSLNGSKAHSTDSSLIFYIGRSKLCTALGGLGGLSNAVPLQMKGSAIDSPFIQSATDDEYLTSFLPGWSSNLHL